MSPLPRPDLLAAAPAEASADVLVVGTRPAAGADPDAGPESGPDTSPPPVVVAAEGLDAAFGEDLAALLALAGATGKAEEVVRLPTRGAVAAPLLVAVGLGPHPDDRPADGTVGAPDVAEQVRRGAGAAARALPSTATTIAVGLSTLDLAAAVEGFLLGAYTFTAYRGAGSRAPAPDRTVHFLCGGERGGLGEADRGVLAWAADLARAVCTARDLVNTPPNDLFPAAFAERARALAEEAGVTVEILDEQELADGGYGGVLGVGQGSSRPPRLVRLRWSPPSPRARVALVGKGITFDTGGISIKPAANMDHMTADMSGAAGVVAATVLAARQGLPVEVVATVPMAENMPSGTAYRPGDVLRMYGGRTVEVLNTDAEGRLVLADAIVRACEDAPDYLVETSTLTGAQLVALGSRTPGVMGADAFRDRVVAHAVTAGDGGWAMPFPEELRADLDSRIADLANVTNHRFGGMLVGGIFLREFVAGGVPWAHLDIAGPAFNTGGPHGYTPKGGTGVPVRTLAAVLADIAAHG